jgi:hypothetical protein
LQPPWQGRFTLGEALAWVLSVGYMVVARGMEVVHLISARAVVLLLVTSFNNCRMWTLLILTPRGELLSSYFSFSFFLICLQIMLSKILFEFQPIKYAQLWNLALLPCLSFHNWSGLINIDTLKSCVFADVCIFALVIVGGESLQVVNGILTKLLDALW